MKILVLAETYPMNGGPVCPMYIHMRNRYYQKQGIDVTVINFRAEHCGDYEGIPVITQQEYKRKYAGIKFDLLVSHQSNIKHHYRFIQKWGSKFEKIVFVFHGHEVLRISKMYPPLYPWKKQNNPLWLAMKDLYDSFKLYAWRMFFTNKKNLVKSQLVFVSAYMMDEFIKNTGVDPALIQANCHVIYNSVGKLFEEREYFPQDPIYDFVTIRRNIDGEKYCVDVVNELAKSNPRYRFLVVGKGELFSHIEKADNLEWQDRNLYHEEMFDLLSRCRFALMPTKLDAQGLMMCEMATYGMPLITTDLPVCHEVLDDFENVFYISNTGKDDLSIPLEKLKNGKCVPNTRNEKLFEANTSGKEVELFNRIVQV